MEQTVLNFDTETKIAMLGGTKDVEDTQKVSTAIYEFLKAEGSPASEPTINEQVDGRTIYKRKALRELVTKGDIIRTGTGKRGDPYLYSCSLVPAIYTGREKQDTEMSQNANNNELIARPRNLAELSNIL